MKQEQMVRYSQQCQQRSITQRNQSLYSHEERYQLDHQYIRSSTFQRKTRNYRDQLENLISPYKTFQTNIIQTLNKLKFKIDSLITKFEDQINQAVQNQYFPRSSKEKKKLYKSLINNNYSELSCMEIFELMSVMDDKFNNQSESSSKVYQKIQRIGHRIQKDLDSIVATSNLDVKDTYSITFLSFSQSTIKKQQESIFPSQTFILEDLNMSLPKTNTNTQSENKFAKNKKIYELSDQDNSEQNYYLKLQKQQKIKNKYVDPNCSQKLILIKRTQTQRSPNVIKNKIQSSHQQPLIDSDDNIDFEQQENIDKLKQYIRSTQIIIANHHIYWGEPKIQKLEDIKKFIDAEGYKFDTKVKICKILYHYVIKTGENIFIPKIKFIAGDQTGVAVFVTNFVPQIKIDAQFEMRDCSFQHYQRSPEISNNKTFKTILQPKITVNYKGVYVNNFIKQITNDLFYNIPDSRCYLIRHVGKKLRTNKIFNIHRMIVQIRFIINVWSSGAFCQVGDSSGVMMAYLKKQENMNYKQGDVLRLIKIKAQRGKQRNNLIQEEIIFIDAYQQQSKIYPFYLQFPSINDEIIC